MTNWYYHDPAQGRVGPIDADTLRGHFHAGRIGRDTLLWREGLREWQPLERLSAELELDGDLSAPTPPPLPPSAVAHSATPSPGANDPRDAGYIADAPLSSQSARPSDYAPAHVARRQPAPPPKRGLSGCMIVVIVLAVLAIPVLGILVAIALPAYQDYTLRAKLAGALATASAHKTQVAEYYLEHESCPNNESPGFLAPVAYAGTQIAAIEFGALRDNGHCAIKIELRGFNSDYLDGKKVWQSFDPANSSWNCSSDVEKPSLLPPSCRS